MSKRIAIFTDDPGWHGARLKQAFAQQGCNCEFVTLQSCGFAIENDQYGISIPGFESLPDGVFVRGVPGGSLEQVVLYLDILHALKHLGICVYNDARAIERSVDKGMTSFLLNDAGVPTPATWVLEDQHQLSKIMLNEFEAGHELVFKPLFGSQGKGLLKISSFDELPEREEYSGVYYLQRYIDTGSDDVSDWRVFVIHGKAVAAMLRRGQGWISNVAQGARCHAAVLDQELKSLAESAAAALGMNYAGVDILRDGKQQPYVLEVNSIPAWKGLQQVTPVDVADLLVEDFLGCCSDDACTEVVS